MNYQEDGKRFIQDCGLEDKAKFLPEFRAAGRDDAYYHHIGTMVAVLCNEARDTVKAPKDAMKKADKISKLAQQLSQELSEYNEDHRFSNYFVFEDGIKINEAIESSDKIAKQFEYEGLSKRNSWKEADFISVRLAGFYTEHFNGKIANTASGDFVRFVQTLYRFGGLKEILGETIKTAVMRSGSKSQTK